MKRQVTCYYDTDSGRVIFYKGTAWKNLDDTPLSYTVTNTLTHVTNSNTVSSAAPNQAYMATLSPGSGYVMSSVQVTMAETDITAFVYDSNSNTIYIPSVRGSIVITASAS